MVLCERGDITFHEKVMNVQDSGGLAAVIYKNEPGNFYGTLGDGNTSDIPALSLSQEAGQWLVANKLGLTGEVFSELHIDCNAALRFTRNRMMIGAKPCRGIRSQCVPTTSAPSLGLCWRRVARPSATPFRRPVPPTAQSKTAPDAGCPECRRTKGPESPAPARHGNCPLSLPARPGHRWPR